MENELCENQVKCGWIDVTNDMLKEIRKMSYPCYTCGKSSQKSKLIKHRHSRK